MQGTNRRRAYEIVRDAPGAAVADVARALEVDHSTAAYHLRRLEADGRVRSRPAGRVRAYFANGHGLCPLLTWVLPRTRASAAGDVLEALEEAGSAGVTAAGLVRDGVDEDRARWALRRLRELGLAERFAHGTYRVPEGRLPCVRHAREASRCGAWGRCEVSRGDWRPWEDEARARPRWAA